ncbi:hypothetical protein SLEP1_g37801 [Rubroshorea leprosula]|uniref:Uncharacterized protein n=1 Tax=Rubroshorea leprosula TaxID=152421 RepID=A0AAV5KVU8_9ROSI|nr:hypothetical protein SLEP1_g37801 [Rubroshorea leprosula]
MKFYADQQLCYADILLLLRIKVAVLSFFKILNSTGLEILRLL